MKRTISVPKSFERIFIWFGLNLPCSFGSCIMMTSIVTFTLKILLCLSFFLYFSLIVLFVFSHRKIDKTVYSFLITVITVKIYITRTSLQVFLSMLPLFFDKFEIYKTHQPEIKNVLLKTSNKQNSTIDNSLKRYGFHWVKSVRIRSYFVSLRIQSECEKTRTRITLNMDTVYTVYCNQVLDRYNTNFFKSYGLESLN